MIDPERCQIIIKLPVKPSNLKALVTFKQGGVTYRGFMLVDGRYGLWLKAPQIYGKTYVYFDENTERFRRLGDKVIETYNQKKEQADTNEMAQSFSDDEINIDGISLD